jgi:hypothetical protein
MIKRSLIQCFSIHSLYGKICEEDISLLRAKQSLSYDIAVTSTKIHHTSQPPQGDVVGEDFAALNQLLGLQGPASASVVRKELWQILRCCLLVVRWPACASVSASHMEPSARAATTIATIKDDLPSPCLNTWLNSYGLWISHPSSYLFQDASNHNTTLDFQQQKIRDTREDTSSCGQSSAAP